MVPAEQVISEYLRSVLLGSNPRQKTLWPVFYGRLPNEPDACIAVHRDSIPTEGRHHRSGQTQHHEGLQIRVRHQQYSEGQAKIEEISDSLDTIVRKVLSVGTKRYRIQSVTQLTTPSFIGPDTNNRLNFVLNCSASIQAIS